MTLVEPRRRRYGAATSQFVETWAPPSAAIGEVVMIHGGWWRDEYDLHLMDALSVWLCGRGWRVHNVEYRRTGSDGGGWPTTFADVCAASTASVDSPPIVVGHSAGGHLALLAATRLPSAAVVALAPITDPSRCVAERWGGGATELFFGEATPGDDAYRDGSPLAHFAAETPTVVVHGTQDSRVPIEHSRDFVAATGAELWEYPGEEHFFVIDPEHAVWPRIESWMRDAVHPHQR